MLDPAALLFTLGFAALELKSDLEIPPPLPKLFSLQLIIAVGSTDHTQLAASGLTPTVLLFITAAMFLARNNEPCGGCLVAIMSLMSLMASPGSTFPCRLTLGLPLYWAAIRWMWGS